MEMAEKKAEKIKEKKKTQEIAKALNMTSNEPRTLFRRRNQGVFDGFASFFMFNEYLK
jgi:hypothetical protein